MLIPCRSSRMPSGTPPAFPSVKTRFALNRSVGRCSLQCLGCREINSGSNFCLTLFFFVAGLGFLRIRRFVVLSHAYQETDKIVQVTGAERRSIVRGHQRIRVSLDACHVGLHKQMESTVQGLQLQREIVFVAENSGEGLSSTSLDGDRPAGAV